MTKDRSDLVNKALEILKIKETGQTAEVEDYNIVDDEVEGLLDELSTREICDDFEVEEIPDVLFRWVSVLLADRVSYEFGIPSDPNLAAMAEKKLRQISDVKVYDKTVETDYF